MHSTFEFLSDIRHLLVDTLLLQFSHSRTTNICDELKRISVTLNVTSGGRTCVSPRILAAILGERSGE